jgi:hypothetical protein
MEQDKVIEGLLELIAKHQAIEVEYRDKADSEVKIVNDFKAALSHITSISTSNKYIDTAKAIATKPKLIKAKKRVAKAVKPKTTINNLLKDTIVSYLTEKQTLLSASSLREKYEEVTGKTIKVANFSPRIAELTRKKLIVLHKIEGNPIATKFMYALPTWHVDGILKQEYLEKAKAGQQAQLL